MKKKYDFLDPFLLIDHRILFEKKSNFEDTFSAKIEVSGWMKTNMTAASYHSRILSPSLTFAVKWPNLDLKVSIEKGLQQEMSKNCQCLEHESFDTFII